MSARPPSALPPPGLEHVVDLTIEVGAPVDVGETPVGRRRLIPILGGRVVGAELSGRVLPGGADFQLLTSPSLTSIHARYVIETDQAELVYIENSGVRTASAEAMARLQRGEPVDPSGVYFRTVPRFETAAQRLAWLMESLFVGTGARRPSCVELSFFRVT